MLYGVLNSASDVLLKTERALHPEKTQLGVSAEAFDFNFNKG
jgi:hypothetical protein